jgi:hypothetical protein
LWEPAAAVCDDGGDTAATVGTPTARLVAPAAAPPLTLLLSPPARPLLLPFRGDTDDGGGRGGNAGGLVDAGDADDRCGSSTVGVELVAPISRRTGVTVTTPLPLPAASALGSARARYAAGKRGSTASGNVPSPFHHSEPPQRCRRTAHTHNGVYKHTYRVERSQSLERRGPERAPSHRRRWQHCLRPQPQRRQRAHHDARQDDTNEALCSTCGTDALHESTLGQRQLLRLHARKRRAHLRRRRGTSIKHNTQGMRQVTRSVMIMTIRCASQQLQHGAHPKQHVRRDPC